MGTEKTKDRQSSVPRVFLALGVFVGLVLGTFAVAPRLPGGPAGRLAVAGERAGPTPSPARRTCLHATPDAVCQAAAAQHCITGLLHNALQNVRSCDSRRH